MSFGELWKVATYGCQNDGLREADTMEKEGGREGGREGREGRREERRTSP